jgi:hypothetical protein
VSDGEAKSRESEESERWRSKEKRVSEPEGAESQYRMKLVSSKLNQELELNQLLHYKHQLPISYMIHRINNTLSTYHFRCFMARYEQLMLKNIVF